MEFDLNKMAIFLLNTLGEHITIIDNKGNIIYVNQPWCSFANNNNSSTIDSEWTSKNYLSVCRQASNNGDEFGQEAFVGIQNVIRTKESFYLEYPCHSPDKQRWFMMRVIPLPITNCDYYSIIHYDITIRKIAEEEAIKNAQYDGLTQIHNRHYGDNFLLNELKRCQRLFLPISVGIIDIDDFKGINDTHGHLIGDQCLKIVAQLINNLCKRPSDCCYRFGGDEFVIIWGNLSLDQAQNLADTLLKNLAQLNIINSKKQRVDVSISIGLTNHPCPTSTSDYNDLLNIADNALYIAKNTGKNQIKASSLQ